MTIPSPEPDRLAVLCFLTRPSFGRLREPTSGIGPHDHTVRVALLGPLDRSTRRVMTDAVTAAARNPGVLSPWTVTPAIQLDLSGLSFLDVAGIRALEAARTALLALGCRLCLTLPTPSVLRLLDLAVREDWLPGDVHCAGEFPWPRVRAPLFLSPPARRRTA